MATLATLVVKIRAHNADFRRVMRQTERDALKTGQTFKALNAQVGQLTSGWVGGAAALGGLALGFRAAWQAADGLEAANRRLAATAKITGTSLQFMETTAAGAKSQFQLSSRIANDLTVELSKLTSKAGDISQASSALGAFLDIGAARGLNAEQTLQAVRQAILGIDEGTDKLFNANPSVLYKQYADAIGVSAEALSDQQKAQAIVNAAMRDGAKVVGEYNRFLQTEAGLSAQAAVRAEEAAAAFGRATASIRRGLLFLKTEGSLILRDFIGGIQLWSIKVATAFMAFPHAAKKALGLTMQAFATGLAHLNAMLPKALQFDFVDGALGNLASIGKQLVEQADAAVKPLMENMEAMNREVLQEMGVLARDASGGMDALAAGTNRAASAAERAAAAFQEMWDKYKGNMLRAPAVNLAGVPKPPPPIIQRDAATGAVSVNAQGGFGGPVSMNLPRPVRESVSLGDRLRDQVHEITKLFRDGFADVLSKFGPSALAVAAVFDLLKGAMEPLRPVIEALRRPLEIIGRLLGQVLAPVIELLVPPLQILATVVTYVIQGLGWLIEVIGKFIDRILPGNQKLDEFGQQMQDAAIAARRAIWAQESLTEAVNQTTSALNSPEWNAALARFRAGGGGRAVPGGGGGDGAPGGGGGGGGRGGRGEGKVEIQNLYVTSSAMDGETLLDEVERAARRRGASGGVVRFPGAVRTPRVG